MLSFSLPSHAVAGYKQAADFRGCNSLHHQLHHLDQKICTKPKVTSETQEEQRQANSISLWPTIYKTSNPITVTEPGELTESGLLYEGSDFQQWDSQLLKVLSVHGVRDRVFDKFEYFDENDVDFLEDLTERRLACDLTLARISPVLRKRIPDALLSRPFGLHCWLERFFDHPFGLLALPAELRNRVYAYAIGKDAKLTIAPLRRGTNRYPPITAVSQQVRAETLPLYYTQSILKIDLTALSKGMDLQMTKEADFLSMSSLRTECGQLSIPHLKHLREVHLSIRLEAPTTLRRSRNRIRALKFVFSPNGGLRMLPIALPALSSESEKKLKDHIDKIEEMRRLLGLQGEALVLALTCDESLWKYGTLQLGR